ncbi:PDR/VanB family oxidoreductase [Bacillus sp. KH172YL63]|uniref:PDR/VanB family oxidoreductase n=1 Tax=Bacillus sp. KH172YL63 TaxID=2709784 RepID=UPI00156751B3|nr:PDR/VanB family oxidoreductase [Bacillus sp. KH172YL63]
MQIDRIIEETKGVKRFSLVPAYGTGPLPRFSGGSHITTFIESGNQLIARSYSLTNSPSERESYEIAISLSKTSQGGSKYWHEQVKKGDVLQISHPRNHFPLSFKAKHHAFYAAGIGITPFLSMMAELKRDGPSFELHYVTKSCQDCPFYSYLMETYPKETRFYFSEEKRLTGSSLWEHRIGTHVYFCGPSSFIEAFTNTALSIGYPASAIHFERFTPPETLHSHAFIAEVSSGSIAVSEGETLLDALLAAGVDAPYSCRAGRCGTCEVNVLEGEILHGDSFLSEQEREEGRSILTCVSRAKRERIVIEL